MAHQITMMVIPKGDLYERIIGKKVKEEPIRRMNEEPSFYYPSGPPFGNRWRHIGRAVLHIEIRDRPACSCVNIEITIAGKDVFQTITYRNECDDRAAAVSHRMPRLGKKAPAYPRIEAFPGLTAGFYPINSPS